MNLPVIYDISLGEDIGSNKYNIDYMAVAII